MRRGDWDLGRIRLRCSYVRSTMVIDPLCYDFGLCRPSFKIKNKEWRSQRFSFQGYPHLFQGDKKALLLRVRSELCTMIKWLNLDPLLSLPEDTWSYQCNDLRSGEQMALLHLQLGRLCFSPFSPLASYMTRFFCFSYCLYLPYSTHWKSMKCNDKSWNPRARLWERTEANLPILNSPSRTFLEISLYNFIRS